MKKGEIIDQTWIVDRPLGRGGMGSVYRCHNVVSDKILAAVKVLSGSLRHDKDAVARFVREAEILHRLDDPSVVRVRNVRADADPPYIEMDYVDGQALTDLLEDGAIPIDRAVYIAGRLFSALAYLHANDVCHRDIKPDNVLLCSDTMVTLVDFGLAFDASVTRLTQHNVAFGTVSYAPPEWLKPSTLDPVSWDLYAAGVVLWEMLTGEIPFPASGEGPPRQQALQVMLAKQSAPPLDPGSDFPPMLRSLVSQLTHPQPERRPQRAQDVIDRLEAVASFLAGEWRPAPTQPSGERTKDPADLPTAVPPPHRYSYGDMPALVPQESGGFSMKRILLWGVPLMALAGVLGMVAGLSAGPEPMPEAPPRSVDLRLPEVPDVALLQVSVDRQRPDTVVDGVAHFDAIAPGQRLIRWVYGVDCPLERCPGPDCGDHCGSAQEIQTLTEGEGAAGFDLSFAVPRARVVVQATALSQRKEGGLFKKRKAPVRLRAFTGDQSASSTTHRVLLPDIPAGDHTVVVELGTCPARHRGCWPAGSCPKGCSSTEIPVRVGWNDQQVVVSTSVPIPD